MISTEVHMRSKPKFRILIVSQDSDAGESPRQQEKSAPRKSLAVELGQCGFEVRGDARSGAEAIEKTATFSPDLVIFDCDTMITGALLAARAMQGVAPNLPLLLFTSHVMSPRTEKQLRDAGFRGVVSKSESDSLVPAILAVLRGRRHFPTPEGPGKS